MKNENFTADKRPAYSYLRFSTLEQKKGDSHRRQSERPEGVCQQFGWQLQDRTYKDCGSSAYRGKNRKKGDLSVFLAALEGGELAENPVLILEDLDRLSRDKIMPSMDCARKILECGCDIYSIIERKLYTRTHLDDPMGLMGLIWRFYLAREESEKKADRSRQNWAEKHKQAAEKGTVFTKICPGWLKVVDQKGVGGRRTGGRFVEVPERVAVVKNLFKWCIEGQGLQQIMRRLEAAQVPPFRSGWAQKYIWEILRDRRVLGDLPTTSYGDEKKPGQTIAGYYPAIIDQRTYDAAQDAIKSRKGKSGRRGDFINLFTGLVKYPEHECNMVFLSKPKRNKSGLHQYRYLVSYLGWKGRKPYVAIRYDRFEAFVLGWLYDLAGDLMPHEPADETVAALRVRRKFLEGRIKEVAAQLSSVSAVIPAIVNQLAEMETEKSKLTAEIEASDQKGTRPPLDETKALLGLLKTTTCDALKELRQQIRQRLLLHVEGIDVSVRTNGWAYLTIRLASGLKRRVCYALEGDAQGLWGEDATSPDADLAHLGAQWEAALKEGGDDVVLVPLEGDKMVVKKLKPDDGYYKNDD